MSNVKENKGKEKETGHNKRKRSYEKVKGKETEK